MQNFLEMVELLEHYDPNDYDVVKELIPLIFSESLGEYNREFHFGDYNKDDLKFIIIDRIFWFLVDNSKWTEEIDIDIINELVYEYYEK